MWTAEGWVLPLVCFVVGAALGLATAWWSKRRSEADLTVADPSEAIDATVELVAEHLPVAVLVFSSTGRVRYANKQACALLFEGESAEGRDFLQLASNAPAAVSHALMGSEDTLFTLDHEGTQQTFQTMHRKVVIESAEYELLLINPLTREVSRRELDVLKKVIRVINHELNNSLASLSSLVSSGRFVVEHPEKIASLPRVLDGIEARTQHLQHFLSDYAQLSKLPAARARQVQWGPLLERLRQLFPTVSVVEPFPDEAWFDEVQVEQALINMLKNAHEAGGDASEVSIVVRLVDQQQEIGVLDRGAGFSQEALSSGLLPFYTTKEQGSGVGLAMCREVADNHRGTLRIRNREEGGSAVYLVLPTQGQPNEHAPSVALTLTRT